MNTETTESAQPAQGLAVLTQSDHTKLPHLFAALANATKDFRPIEKNRHVTIKPRDKSPYSFKFADLAELIDATRPALSAHGLSVLQPTHDEGGKLYLYTILAHAEGAALVSRVIISGPDPELDLKVYGGELAYLRRYHYSALLVLAADDDIDDNGNDPEFPDEGRQTSPARKTPARRSANAPDGPGPTEPAAGEKKWPSEKRIGVGEKKWLDTKLAALKLSDETQAAMLKRHGAPSWSELTMAQFTTIRAELLKV